jgi:hypothetical protein
VESAVPARVESERQGDCGSASKKHEDGAVESAAAAENDEPVDTYVAIFSNESTEFTE